MKLFIVTHTGLNTAVFLTADQAADAITDKDNRKEARNMVSFAEASPGETVRSSMFEDTGVCCVHMDSPQIVVRGSAVLQSHPAVDVVLVENVNAPDWQEDEPDSFKSRVEAQLMTLQEAAAHKDKVDFGLEAEIEYHQELIREMENAES